jgi:hypothetical protein
VKNVWGTNGCCPGSGLTMARTSWVGVSPLARQEAMNEPALTPT